MSKMRKCALPTAIAVGVAFGVTTLGSTSASASHTGGGVHQEAGLEVVIPATTVGFSTPGQGPEKLCFFADTTPTTPPTDGTEQCVPTSGSIGHTVDGLTALINATYVLSSSTHPNNVVARVGRVCPDDARDPDSDPHFGAVWEATNATYQPGSNFLITATVNGESQEVLNVPAPQPGNPGTSVYLTAIRLC